MIKEIEKLVEDVCKKENNYYGYRTWTHHISSVLKFARILAEKLDVDKEIVEIAALLHDYASVLNKEFYQEHHIHGARLAEEILQKYNYPQEKIEIIKHCIISHRASKNIPRETKEAEIIADADSLAHFDNVNSLFHLAFVIHKMDCDEGTKWVLDKLERSWYRLSDSTRDIIKDKYDAIKKSFNKKSNPSSLKLWKGEEIEE